MTAKKRVTDEKPTDLTDEQMERKLMAKAETNRQACLQELDEAIVTVMKKYNMMLDVSFVLNPRTGMQPSFNVIPAPKQ